MRLLGHGETDQRQGGNTQLGPDRADPVLRCKHLEQPAAAAGHHQPDREAEAQAEGPSVGRPHIADALVTKGYFDARSEAFHDLLADGGAAVFYEGALAEAISSHVRNGGGALTVDDLAAYEAIERPALVADIDDWHIATNPPPAVGGAVLTAMLLACGDLHASDWDSESLDRLIRVQRACLDFRRDRLDVAEDVGGEAARDLVDGGQIPRPGLRPLGGPSPELALDGVGAVKRAPLPDQLSMSGPAIYRVVVQGDLDPTLGDSLSGMSISRRTGAGGEIESILVGRLPDQAALSSVLNSLYDLHFPVISADCLESG